MYISILRESSNPAIHQRHFSARLPPCTSLVKPLVQYRINHLQKSAVGGRINGDQPLTSWTIGGFQIDQWTRLRHVSVTCQLRIEKLVFDSIDRLPRDLEALLGGG